MASRALASLERLPEVTLEIKPQHQETAAAITIADKTATTSGDADKDSFYLKAAMKSGDCPPLEKDQPKPGDLVIRTSAVLSQEGLMAEKTLAKQKGMAAVALVSEQEMAKLSLDFAGGGTGTSTPVSSAGEDDNSLVSSTEKSTFGQDDAKAALAIDNNEAHNPDADKVLETLEEKVSPLSAMADNKLGSDFATTERATEILTDEPSAVAAGMVNKGAFANAELLLGEGGFSEDESKTVNLWTRCLQITLSICPYFPVQKLACIAPIVHGASQQASF